MIESAVTLLPQPDSPTIPSVSPLLMWKSMPSTARTTPSSVKKWVFEPFDVEKPFGHGPPPTSYLAVISVNASSVRPMSSASTSLWVTHRIARRARSRESCTLRAPQPATSSAWPPPSAPRRRVHPEDDDVRLHAGQIDAQAGELGKPSASVRALAWSSARRSTMRSSATMPGGGDDAGLPHAAAEHLAQPPRALDEVPRAARSSSPPARPGPWTRRTSPSRPAGRSRARAALSATAALKSRAPSRWTGTPALVRHRGHRRDLLGRAAGAAVTVVRVLQADQAGRRRGGCWPGAAPPAPARA